MLGLPRRQMSSGDSGTHHPIQGPQAIKMSSSRQSFSGSSGDKGEGPALKKLKIEQPPRTSRFQFGDLVMVGVPPGPNDEAPTYGESDSEHEPEKPTSRLVQIADVKYDKAKDTFNYICEFEHTVAQVDQFPERKMIVAECYLQRCKQKIGDHVDYKAYEGGGSVCLAGTIRAIRVYGNDFIYKIEPDKIVVAAKNLR